MDPRADASAVEPRALVVLSIALGGLIAVMTAAALISMIVGDTFDARQAGGGFALLMVSGALQYPLFRAPKARCRSRILANIALCCGLAVFWRPEHLGATPAADFAIGGLRVAIGALGVWAAVASCAARGDGGTGLVRPVLGGVFSVFHVFAALLVFVVTSDRRAGQPWTYEVAGEGFHITLPSGRWRQLDVAGNDVLVAFGAPVPRMQFGISVERHRTAADFAAFAEQLERSFQTAPTLTEPARCRDGPSSPRRRVRYCAATAQNHDGETVFVGRSLTWLERERSIVEVMFDGSLEMYSDLGKKHSRIVVQDAAEKICMSVE